VARARGNDRFRQLRADRGDVVDTTDLGLDRFDASGRGRVAADPIALPFPETLTVPEKAS
jgi:hypothetical protein